MSGRIVTDMGKAVLGGKVESCGENNANLFHMRLKKGKNGVNGK